MVQNHQVLFTSLTAEYEIFILALVLSIWKYSPLVRVNFPNFKITVSLSRINFRYLTHTLVSLSCPDFFFFFFFPDRYFLFRDQKQCIDASHSRESELYQLAECISSLCKQTSWRKFKWKGLLVDGIRLNWTEINSVDQRSVSKLGGAGQLGV